jgi:hypothetical protein
MLHVSTNDPLTGPSRKLCLQRLSPLATLVLTMCERSYPPMTSCLSRVLELLDFSYLESELPRSLLRGIGSLVPQLELYGTLATLMILHLAPNYIAGYFIAHRSPKVAVAPQSASPQLPPHVATLAKQL